MIAHPKDRSSRASTPRRRSLFALGGAALAAAALLPPPALAQRGGSPSAVVNSSTDEYHARAKQHYRGARRSPPPRGGRYVYGHWTPYNPPDPASYPATARKHVVASGDTLYDISKKHYQDALLWPALWDANSWIRDPHWIYPGDVLLVPPLNVLPPGPLAPPVASLPSITDAYYPAGWVRAANCGHFIADPNNLFFGEIVDQEKDPPSLAVTLGDVVYVDVGAKDGVLPGDEFAVVYPREHFSTSVTQREREEQQVLHPITNQKLGYAMQMVGRIKIILLGEDTSTAQVVNSCDAIEMGYDIYPFTEMAMPLTRKTSAATPHVNAVPERGRGAIVYFSDLVVSATQGDLCSLDLGSDQGIMPGDVFQVYRNEAHDFLNEDVDHLGKYLDKREAMDTMRNRRPVDELDTFWRQRRIHDLPPRIVGEVVVLYAEKDTSTAKITKSTGELQLGDLVVYKPIDAGLGEVATVGGAQ